MDQIVLRNVTKSFATKTLGNIVAVDNFNLSVREGECFSFLGPSGCGKSTTLRMIAGFEDLTTGEIELCGKLVSSKSKNLYVPPENRGLGMVFQAFAVWPHMNVFENVAFPLRLLKMNRVDMEKRVNEALHHTSLDGLGHVYPSDLSGGQQQRIALARAIVTHDQSEAMAISDRMMVCDMGKIMQIDTPENLYNKPVNRFVHSFLGESTFLNVVVRNGEAYAEGDMQQSLDIPVPADAEETMIVATRPNSIALSQDEGYNTYVEKRIFLTDRTEYLIPVGSQKLKVQTPHRISFREGERCCVKLIDPMWYPAEDEAVEKERARRQLI